MPLLGPKGRDRAGEASLEKMDQGGGRGQAGALVPPARPTPGQPSPSCALCPAAPAPPASGCGAGHSCRLPQRPSQLLPSKGSTGQADVRRRAHTLPATLFPAVMTLRRGFLPPSSRQPPESSARSSALSHGNFVTFFVSSSFCMSFQFSIPILATLLGTSFIGSCLESFLEADRVQIINRNKHR